MQMILIARRWRLQYPPRLSLLVVVVAVHYLSVT